LGADGSREGGGGIQDELDSSTREEGSPSFLTPNALEGEKDKEKILQRKPRDLGNLTLSASTPGGSARTNRRGKKIRKHVKEGTERIPKNGWNLNIRGNAADPTRPQGGTERNSEALGDGDSFKGG